MNSNLTNRTNLLVLWVCDLSRINLHASRTNLENFAVIMDNACHPIGQRQASTMACLLSVLPIRITCAC